VTFKTIAAMALTNSFAIDVSAERCQNSNAIMISAFLSQGDVIYCLIAKIKVMKESPAVLAVDVI
jgi:hypothetical protein